MENMRLISLIVLTSVLILMVGCNSDVKKNEKLIKDTLHFDPNDTFIRFSSLKKKGIQEAWNAIYELCDLNFE